MSTAMAELDAFYQFAQCRLSREGSAAMLEEMLRKFRQQENWHPRTPLGQRLKELRRQFVAEGGELLTPDEVATGWR